MIWLFVATWINGQDPRDYKLQTKIGPFDTVIECYAAGALVGNNIQSKDQITNFLGACTNGSTPKFMDMKSMWDMTREVTGCDWRGCK